MRRIQVEKRSNADTPTSLGEAAAVQWQWLEQTGHGRDQFNSLTERLVAAWRRNLTLIEQKSLGRRPARVHFAASRGEASGEDAMTTTLLMATCEQAGYRAAPLFMDQIGQSQHDARFYDHQGRHLDVVFKLYPWEWMVRQPFGEACFRDMMDDSGGTVWIEPPYKMLWSNKGLFAVLGPWFVDGEPAGMGIREDTRQITANESCFIPHSISDGPVTYERKPVPDAAEIEALLTLLTLENYPTLTTDSHGILDYIEGIVRQ